MMTSSEVPFFSLASGPPTLNPSLVISFDKKLIHLPWCCKTEMQTYCGADSRTALTADLKLAFRFAVL